jgi:pimeloyl-ACP methyl ester carboxylesterase
MVYIVREKIQIKKVQLANGETLAYRETGEGEKVILLIHGNMVSSKYWERLMPKFPPEYKISAPDLRGSGLSTYNKPIKTIEELSDDLKMFVDKLGLRNFCLVGWSFGGGVAMEFCADYPRIARKLALTESLSYKGYPHPRLDDHDCPIPGQFMKTKEEVLQIGAEPLASYLKNRDFDGMRAVWEKIIFNVKIPQANWYQELIEDIFLTRNYPDCAWAWHNFNISSEHNGIRMGNNKVANIKLPTLCTWAENDMVRMISKDTCEETARALNADFHIIKNSGHALHIDQEEKFLKLLTEFFETDP